MEVQEFQEKLAGLCAVAARNGKKLNKKQMEEFFSGSGMTEDQQTLVARYLMSQGITVDGASAPAETETKRVPEEQKEEQNAEQLKENPCLTEEDKEYLRFCKEELEYQSGNDEKLIRYMGMVIDFVSDMYRDGMNLPDLIQESNLNLLTILAGDVADLKDEELCTLIRKGVKQAVDAQDEQNFEDDCLVAKVQKLDSMMRELTDEDDPSLKFSVEELAIMLDMDIDEMKDIIRLTGDM